MGHNEPAIPAENRPYEETTYKIIGAAMAVHNELGPGHRESVYEEAMVRCLLTAGLAVDQQVPVPISLDDGDLLTYFLDLRVQQHVVVEIKALSHPTTADDLAQVIDYLAATGNPVALLLNFGRPRLEYHRIFPPRKLAEHRRRRWSKPARS